MKNQFWSHKYILKSLFNQKNVDKCKIKYNNLKPYIKTDKTVIQFDDTEIAEYKFHKNKTLILINNIDIN